MGNQDQWDEKDEVLNPEQFQVDRNPDKQEDKQENTNDSEENDYTPGETKFADGEGTRLDEETDKEETDNSENPNTQQGDSTEHAAFESPDDEDDPA